MTPTITKTPLAEKLGLEEHFNVLVYNVPGNYGDELGDLPAYLNWMESNASESTDFIHLFCINEEELRRNLKKYKPALRKNGILWVSWPKENTGIPATLNKETIKKQLSNAGLKCVRTESIDENWQGMKFKYPA